MQDTLWMANAVSVFLCWIIIERFMSGAFTETDQGYKLSMKTTNMATRAADCHSKLLKNKNTFPPWVHLVLYFFIFTSDSLLTPLASFTFSITSLRFSDLLLSYLKLSTNHFIALLCLSCTFHLSPLSLWGDD